ncbi:MAG: hypothetical protein DMF92_19870 [Acidobacteria bacterium]|nr:MAG: hypothetical protein DMF92_19870 [Acidobacteriota bacterium]
MTASATTVRAWLRAAGFGPADTRGGMTWREFLRSHRRSVLAVDFFTVETVHPTARASWGQTGRTEDRA